MTEGVPEGTRWASAPRVTCARTRIRSPSPTLYRVLVSGGIEDMVGENAPSVGIKEVTSVDLGVTQRKGDDDERRSEELECSVDGEPGEATQVARDEDGRGGEEDQSERGEHGCGTTKCELT